MLDYFLSCYVRQEMGPGYVVTNIFYCIAVTLLLSPKPTAWRGWLRRIADMVILWLASVILCSVGYKLLDSRMLADRTMMLILLIGYAVFVSKYKVETRLIRSGVFFSGLLHIITLSEPIGVWFEAIDKSWVWAEHFTWMVVVVLSSLLLLCMTRYSAEELTFIPLVPCILLGTISAVGVVWQLAASLITEPVRVYNLLGSACFFVFITLSYFMFYIVSLEYDQNLELLALQHKRSLDTELLQFSEENYADLHKLRHELRNHMNYIKLLSEAREYDKLEQYVTSVCGEAEEIFSFVECGNSVVNAVMNHMVRQGEAMGVTVDTQIVVPPTLPFKESDFCSLLSNLMENALEAAQDSGVVEPTVIVRIFPQLDYLFIHVENPVNDTVSKQRRLSLMTTKEDRRTHGYGTRIIRELAKKYQGSVKFDMQDRQFTVDVMLCLMEEGNHGEAEYSDL